MGCTIGGVTYSGFNLGFQGAIEGVSVSMATSFALEPSFALSGSEADISVAFSDCADANCSTLTTPTLMASGDVDIEGFRFSASIEVAADGTFDAKLEIPKQTHHFSFNEHSVSGSGSLTSSLSVEVSVTGHGGVSFSLGVGLSSCKVAIFSCGRPGLSVSGDLSPGRIDAKIEVRTVIHFTVSMTV